MWEKFLLYISSLPPITSNNKSSIEVLPYSVLGPEPLKFVALEYYGFILNRKYFVSVSNGCLCGAKIGGVVINPRSTGPAWEDPNWHIDTEELSRYRAAGLGSSKFLRMDRENFVYKKSQIQRVLFDGSSKWGMGRVPYSGRLHISLTNNISREFILLGHQDGPGLVQEFKNHGFKTQAA